MNRCLLIMLAIGALGCEGVWTVENAQGAISTGAEVTQAADEGLAPIIQRVTQRCDEENEYREDFEECMAPYQPIRQGVRLTRRFLTLGQASVDAWRVGSAPPEELARWGVGGDTWIPVAACIGFGLTQIIGAVQDLELGLPDTVTRALAWADTFGNLIEGMCPADLLRSEEDGGD